MRIDEIDEFPAGPPDGMTGDEWVGTPSWGRFVRNKLGANAERVDHDSEAFLDWLRTAAKHRIWETLLRDKHGQPFGTFKAFCEAPKPHGLAIKLDVLLGKLGTASDEVRRLTALQKAEESPLGEHGGAREGRGEQATEQGNNITLNVESVRGTDLTYTLRRLKRDAPELFEQVAAGDLSANAAALKAGFRRPVVQVQGTDPAKTSERLLERFGREWCRALVVELDTLLQRRPDET